MRGASAVEFAIIAPVMILLYFALVEYCQAYMAERKASHVAATLGDLIAQNDAVTAAQVGDMFNISGMVLSPLSVNQLQMCVVSVSLDSTGKNPVVLWGQGYKTTVCAKKGDSFTLPKSTIDPTKPFINPGESVIFSKAMFTYKSPVSYAIKQDIVFTETFYMRPRKSDTVTCADCT
jgi:Flp pilus assembly protein TadG